MLTMNSSFRYWLKQQRRSLDLTQDELAERIGCSSDLIRKIEAGTRRPSRYIAEQLAHLLEVAPENRQLFVRYARDEGRAPGEIESAPALPQVREAADDTTATPQRQRNNLPVPPTLFIGREQELAAAGALLRQQDVRLLTLSGPGGVGKTRLALHVAADAQDAFAEGVCFVGLAPLTDATLVISAIAQALGMKPEGSRPLIETLQDHLRASSLLLLLDNFEQLLDAAPLIAHLLAACSDLKVLITSRAPLRIYGEQEFAVPPLNLPQRETATPSPLTDLSQSAAVRLFAARARLVQPQFALTDENIGAIAGICARLDGLPLAIELAAARSKLFTPQVLLRQLDRPLALLTGGPHDLPARQQTLRGSIAWSYALLAPPEQALFTRLGVFAGGCTLEAISAVCQGVRDQASEVLDRLSALLDHSLLRQECDADGQPRFAMLETIRAFALEQLAERGETEEIERRHAGYYLALAETAEAELWGPDRLVWIERLERDQHNMRAALRWTQSTQGDPVTGLRLAAALWWFWFMRSYVNEARGWLSSGLDRGGNAPAPVRAKVLPRAGILAWFQSDFVQAQAWCSEGLALCRELGDTMGVSYALHGLGLVALEHGDPSAAEHFAAGLELSQALQHIWGSAWSLLRLGQSTWLFAPNESAQATRLLNESLGLFQLMSDEMGMAHALFLLGDIALGQGDVQGARTHYEQSLALSRHCEEKGTAIWALHGLGQVGRHLALYQQACEWYHESLVLSRELREQRGIIAGLEGLASLVIRQGQVELAITLLAAADVMRERIDYPLIPAWRTDYQDTLDLAHARLGDAAFTAAWRAGRMLTVEQALTIASRANVIH
jgi:predicted ATPase/DNA-binding XRE family transcriptional regulator